MASKRKEIDSQSNKEDSSSIHHKRRKQEDDAEKKQAGENELPWTEGDPAVHSDDRKKVKQKSVSWARDDALENIYFVETLSTQLENDDDEATPSNNFTSLMTEEISILYTDHAKVRRQLREVPEYCLKSAIKYGTRKREGKNRWSYTFANYVCITDSESREVITCYRQPITIRAAPISEIMWERHREVKSILENDPRMCNSHTIVVLDQSGSMRSSDVNAFRNRSQAAYGCLALEYVADQLYHLGDEAEVDSLTLIEMNQSATIVFDTEPLDWILFNKLVERQTETKPRFPGNYGPSIEEASLIINREFSKLQGTNRDDLPQFSLVFLSDGKPSDIGPNNVLRRSCTVESLANMLKDRLSIACIGVGAKGTDFSELKHLCSTAKLNGSNGVFTTAGLSASKLGDTLSDLATSMTASRYDPFPFESDPGAKIEDESKEVIPVSKRESLRKSMNNARRYFRQVSCFGFNRDNWENKITDCWDMVPLSNSKSVGFALDSIPFGKGSQRLAYLFYEVDSRGKQSGPKMVAKETKGLRDEEKKYFFHRHFCRIQLKAKELAILFNSMISRSLSLAPRHDRQRAPVITFLECVVYEYENEKKQKAGILVEPYLEGKFVKYTGNKGYVNRSAGRAKIELAEGEASMMDFLEAFSHWSYVFTEFKVLVCDLQGTFYQEGLYPSFLLTDPAICSESKRRSLRYGKTDLGLRGIKMFFKAHKCNLVCRCLGLPDDRACTARHKV